MQNFAIINIIKCKFHKLKFSSTSLSLAEVMVNVSGRLENLFDVDLKNQAPQFLGVTRQHELPRAWAHWAEHHAEGTTRKGGRDLL